MWPYEHGWKRVNFRMLSLNYSLTVEAAMVLHLQSKNIGIGHKIFPTAPLL